MPAQVEHSAPRVHFEQVLREPEPAFETGVPAFIALGAVTEAVRGALAESRGASDGVAALDGASFSQLEARAGVLWGDGYLGFAVRGFFQNGGRRCYVVLPRDGGLSAGLDALATVEDVDLVCAPDLALEGPLSLLEGQRQIITFCAAHGGCFAILDGIGAVRSDGAVDLAALRSHRDALVAALAGTENAALYAPWIKVHGAPGAGFVPPCGHVAGVYARTDGLTGVHKAPANAALEGVIDLQIRIDQAAQAALNPAGINCLRAFPGRGVCVWGARTLSAEDAWRYVSVRRLVLTIGRWLEQSMADVAFEPNDLRLWARIGRDVSAFLEGLRVAGALTGDKPEQAFFVKCDDETNPPETRDRGLVVTEVGVAPVRPGEFIVVRLISGADGVAAQTPE